MPMTFHDIEKAIKRGDLEQIKEALRSGTDANLRNENGATLLMQAASIGNTAIGKLLIERGADLDARTRFPRTDWQWTALSYAVISGKPSFVKLLLECGVSLDASPFSGTLESYIDWVEKYGSATQEQVRHIRAAILTEIQKREPIR